MRIFLDDSKSLNNLIGTRLQNIFCDNSSSGPLSILHREPVLTVSFLVTGGRSQKLPHCHGLLPRPLPLYSIQRRRLHASPPVPLAFLTRQILQM